jgi:hypothetical protein
MLTPQDQMKLPLIAGLLMCLTCSFQAQTAAEYTVTDITGWTSNQMAALPYFDRYVPLRPPGASPSFAGVAQNGQGVTVGSTSGTYGSIGAFAQAGTQTNITAWGTFSWSYWIWDGTDSHFYWGYVNHSPATDVNVDGQTVGYATLPGGSTGVNSPLAYTNHAYLYDRASGTKTDLTPEARRGDPKAINDLNVIVDTYSTSNSWHAFRRTDAGAMQFFVRSNATVTPTVLNNRGTAAGTHITYSDSNRVIVPFVATNGVAMTDLPLPSQGSPDAAAINDINDHGLLVGSSWKQASTYETMAVRWHHAGGGWVAEDLNELITTEGFIIDSAIAVNDAGYIIALGHLDGTDVYRNRALLLTPDLLPAPSAISLRPTDITPTNATLRGKVNACANATTGAFHFGPYTGPTQTNPWAGTINGTIPVVVTNTLTNLQPHTTYRFRVTAANSQGATSGAEELFTTPYDLATWAGEMFGAAAGNTNVAGPFVDFDGDGACTLMEYAMGGNPLVADSAAPVPTIEGGYLTLTFIRATDRHGVGLGVEIATSMNGPWQSGPGFTETFSVTTGPGAIEMVKVRSLLPASGYPSQLLRLRLTYPP